MFIDICGIDGSGKTTHAYLLKEYLEQELGLNTEVIHSFKPNKYSGELKQFCLENSVDFHSALSPKLRSYTFLLDLLDNTCNVLEKNLQIGNVVITEKYIMDPLVFVPLLSGELPYLDKFASLIPVPNIRFFLDIDPQIAHNRIHDRALREGKEIAPKEDIRILISARDRFIEEMKKQNYAFNIDTSDSVENVQEQIRDIIRKKQGV